MRVRFLYFISDLPWHPLSPQRWKYKRKSHQFTELILFCYHFLAIYRPESCKSPDNVQTLNVFVWYSTPNAWYPLVSAGSYQTLKHPIPIPSSHIYLFWLDNMSQNILTDLLRILNIINPIHLIIMIRGVLLLLLILIPQ